MPKIDLSKVPVRGGTIYPPPLDQEVAGRTSQRLGDFAGLTQYGVNIVHLEPGAKASMRHWHEKEDEFLMVTSGTCVLIEDDGETEMTVGDCAAFKAGVPNAHHLVNRSDKPMSFLVIGTHFDDEVAHYPDHGLKVEIQGSAAAFSYEDGRPFEG